MNSIITHTVSDTKIKIIYVNTIDASNGSCLLHFTTIILSLMLQYIRLHHI